MGCWYETCFLTNLPLLPNTRVAAFIVVNSFDVNAGLKLYDVDDITKFVCPPIFGECNECGTLDIIGMSEYTETFLRNLSLFRGELSESDDIADAPKHKYLPYDYSDIRTFLEDIAAGEMYIEYQPGRKGFEKRQLSIHYCFEEAYNLIVNNIKSRKLSYSKRTYGEAVKFEELELLKRVKECTITENDSDEEKNQKTMKLMYLHLSSEWVYRIPFVYRPINWLPIFELDCVETVDMRAFTCAMTLLRKGVFGYHGLGAQQQEMELHRILAKFTIDYTNGYLDKLKEEFVDDPSGWFSYEERLTDHFYGWKEAELEEKN